MKKYIAELKAIRKVCENVRLKVILETGELKDLESIFNASLIAAYAELILSKPLPEKSL